MTTAVQVQYRRGTPSQVAAFTGAAGEMVIDTTNNRVVVQDGSTAGGFPAAKLSEAVTNTRTAVSRRRLRGPHDGPDDRLHGNHGGAHGDAVRGSELSDRHASSHRRRVRLLLGEQHDHRRARRLRYD